MTPETVYTVTRLNHEARGLLESGFPLLWVEGELSNLARPGSGHLYFTLKDEQAQVRCAMFRARNRLLRFQPEAGQQVRVHAQVSLYTHRGDFQLLIEHMEEVGEGALRRAFEELKQQLAREGLFADAAKRPLPSRPARIGLITSPNGAALQDILTTLERRFPGLPAIIYPVPVQGSEAAPSIAAALATANRRGECEVLILARGGGSLEDLWPFNEPTVARAIRASTIPVVTGVGHEVDLTIADLAADLRAPTPTGAAERVVPDREALLRQLSTARQRLFRVANRGLRDRAQRLDALSRRLVHPGHRLHELRERNHALRSRLIRGLQGKGSSRRQRLAALTHRLRRSGPRARLPWERNRLEQAQARLIRALAQEGLPRRRQQLRALARHLEGVSPLATLARGYAIVRRKNVILRQAQQAAPGDLVHIQLARGTLDCRVEERQENEGPDTNA